MMVRTYSCIIPPSPATGTVPCKREIRWNLRSFKARKVPRLPTSRNQATEEEVRHGAAGRSALLPAILGGKGGTGGKEARIGEGDQFPGAPVIRPQAAARPMELSTSHNGTY